MGGSDAAHHHGLRGIGGDWLDHLEWRGWLFLLAHPPGTGQPNEQIVSTSGAQLQSSKTGITACLVIHNEESVIRRCLESIKDVADEILVVHDGPCQDRSLDICTEFGCTIHVRQHIGIGESHRPWLLKAVKTEWVLQIDPDEYLLSGAQASVRQLVQSNRADCYALVWPLWDGTRYMTKNWPHKKVLYRLAASRYLGVPHEEVRIDGTIETVATRLEHQPAYNNLSLVTLRTKWNRWLTVHARALLAGRSAWDTFPDGARLEPHYAFIARWPLFSSIPVFLYHFAATMILGGWRQGFQGFKLGLYTSFYYFALCLRIYELKRKPLNSHRRVTGPD
jgi:glycosyltransferase involved in cell wall biosynthesis